MKTKQNNKGFTLMELIVVIIIISVLSAVALPMYKHTVMKSKFSAVIPPTKALADAQEVFYLNNGNYAFDKEEIDLSVPTNSQTTITLSDKNNYKYVMGQHSEVPGAKYLIYQKHSKRFADNIHCEADKNDEQAKWLCEKGLNGTLLTGSISGSNYLTYLLSGDAGTDKFIREDCAEGYYDDNGTCRGAPAYYYAEEGELKKCPPGTSTGGKWLYASFCVPCPAGQYNDEEGKINCKPCDSYSYQPATGATSCMKCPPGTSKNGSWAVGSTSCVPCEDGKYADQEGQIFCQTCPSGTTSNADHTGCVPL